MDVSKAAVKHLIKKVQAFKLIIFNEPSWLEAAREPGKRIACHRFVKVWQWCIIIYINNNHCLLSYYNEVVVIMTPNGYIGQRSNDNVNNAMCQFISHVAQEINHTDVPGGLQTP